MNIWGDEELTQTLKAGGVAVMPTDTLYGIVGSALDAHTVERIYALRNRRPEKPCIILIHDWSEVAKFSVGLTEDQKNEIQKYRDQPTSVVLDCDDERFEYLHRGTNTLAFRVPMQQELRSLLVEVGPLVAPSANPEGRPPAQNLGEAESYFGAGVNIYIDGGAITGKASQVVRITKDGSVSVLRA